MTAFTPKRDDYREAVQQLHEAAKFCRHIGIDLDRIEPGLVTGSLVLKPELTQQDGCAHAGLLASAADTVCGLTAYSLLEKGKNVLSVNLNISLMSAARGKIVRAEGKVIKAGHRLYFTEGYVWSGDGETDKLVVKVSATMAVV